MARPRTTIYADLVDPPIFDAEVADSQVTANQKWVRATEILLLAQTRLAARQQDYCVDEIDRRDDAHRTKHHADDGDDLCAIYPLPHSH